MYVYLFVDTLTDTPPGSLIPHAFTLKHWDFLWATLPGRPNIWRVALNTLIFAAASSAIVLSVSSTAGYVLSRLNVPFRGFFLAGVMVLHAFPSVTLIIAIFLVLQMVGLYNSLAGVILVKAALDLPLGIWIMKGFYDTVPWEIEMAGIQDGASRFTVWRRLVLPQVRPALLALGTVRVPLGVERIHPAAGAGAAATRCRCCPSTSPALIADDNNFDLALFKSVGVSTSSRSPCSSCSSRIT